MNKIIIDINIETIEEDQKILFDMGYRWNSSYRKSDEIRNKYNFHQNDMLIISDDNLIFKIKKEHIEHFDTKLEYYCNIKVFSRYYKIQKILKKDI